MSLWRLIRGPKRHRLIFASAALSLASWGAFEPIYHGSHTPAQIAPTAPSAPSAPTAPLP